MTALKIILIVIGCLLLYLTGARIVKKFWHFPAPAFIGGFLDSPTRRWVQPPQKLIRDSGVKPGMTVVDLGCGSGAFTPTAARAVGKRGKIYAVDIQADMLRQLKSKLNKPKNKDITNIELKQADAYKLPFKDGSIDLVYMVTVLPEIPDRVRALKEIKRVLKPSGILAVSELLFDPDYPLSSTTVKLCEGEGFKLDRLSGNLWAYTARFKKSPN